LKEGKCAWDKATGSVEGGREGGREGGGKGEIWRISSPTEGRKIRREGGKVRGREGERIDSFSAVHTSSV